LVVSELVTLDGVFEDPGGAEDGEHGGWALDDWCDEIGAIKLRELEESDALVLGRVTYERFAAAWPPRIDAVGFAARMNAIPKYVVSTRDAALDWSPSVRLGDLECVSRLLAEPGKDLLVSGSGRLVRALLARDLVDEIRLLVYPVVVGGGERLFGRDRVALRVAEARRLESGVLWLRYVRT